MKIQIMIPDSAVADVEEYCLVELDDTLRDRIQLIVDTFVSNAIAQMEQRREIKANIQAVQDRLKEIRNIQNKRDADADWHVFKENANAK